jgi:hypothetical protein
MTIHGLRTMDEYEETLLGEKCLFIFIHGEECLFMFFYGP